jgi:hypothetical protein
MPLATRREFITALSAVATELASKRSVRSSWESAQPLPPTEVFLNRAPLAQNSFQPLPLTSVRPKGWLRQQLAIAASGLSGHLDEFWPDVGPQSGWLGGPGESWERGPYFLDGFVPLAQLVEDPRLIAKTKKWMDWTLEHQQANGMIGPVRDDDWWPRMVMLKVLTQHQEATGDPRVQPLMQRYFDYQIQALPGRPLKNWGRYRWQDELASVIWLYNRTGSPSLLDAARLLHDQGHNWRKEFENFPYTNKTKPEDIALHDNALGDAAMRTHGVNNAMALKSSALWWLFSGQEADRVGVTQQLSKLDEYHGLPNGMFSADEHLAGRNPSQGTELCTVVEQMFSLECAIAVLGDPVLGDRLERIAFNALPGACTDDMWAHQYDQQPNQIECSLRQRPWTTNGPESNLYGLEPNFGCCTANMHQGWPKFVSHLWMATPDGGVAAVAYAPCELNTKVRDVPVTIEEQTEYPFGSDILLLVKPLHPIRFRMCLRVPGWADGGSVRVNGKQEYVQPGTFASIDREWKAGDRVEVHFPLKTTASRWYRNSVVVERGPIVFSLDIPTEWRKLRSRGMTADWEARPLGPWNYALDVTTRTEVPALKRSGGVFTLGGAPIRVQVQGSRVPEWQDEGGWAGELPRELSAAASETLTLVPYGSAKLRITAFPSIGNGR